jgi:hypothetical protein
MRHWPIFAAALALALAAVSNAEAVTHRDAHALGDLYKRALDLSQSLTEAESGGVSQLNAGGDAQALDCLETLREASGEVADQLMDVKDVASLAAGLHGARDRRHGDAATRAAVARALEVLPVEQKQITQTAGLCLSQAVVQQKARDASLLIADATTALQAVR